MDLKKLGSISCTNLALMLEGYMEGYHWIKNTNSLEFIIIVTEINLHRLSHKKIDQHEKTGRVIAKPNKVEVARGRKLETQKRGK